MSQVTQIGEADLVSYIEVKRAKTGKMEYYKVVDGVTTPITQKEYEEK